jgi:hypothetical protein
MKPSTTPVMRTIKCHFQSCKETTETEVDEVPQARGGATVLVPAKAAAKETPKMGNGIKLNANGTLTLNGTTYTRDEFRGALEMNIKAQREDPKSPYRNARDPNHKQAVEEINLAYRWLGGELTETDEKQIVAEWHDATQESEVTTLQPHQEIAAIVGSPEGKIALQRARTGQPLDARQAAIVKRHDELEAANNTVARREQASKGGWMKTARPHSIPAELHAIERIADPRERTHAIRQQKAAWRDNPTSPFNDASHPEHKNYVEAMSRLYQAEEELGRQPEDPQ